MVNNAVSEMRRYYSRKVIDVLIKVTRSSLDMLRKIFIVDPDTIIQKKPIILLYSTLMIPNVSIKPNLDDLQETLTITGKNISGVSKGVAQWTSGKENVISVNHLIVYLKLLILFTFPAGSKKCTHRSK